MLLRKIAVFQWARWTDPILQSIRQAQQANLGGREEGRELGRKRTGEKHLIAHFLTS
jgi:hypothetical protein